MHICIYYHICIPNMYMYICFFSIFNTTYVFMHLNISTSAYLYRYRSSLQAKTNNGTDDFPVLRMYMLVMLSASSASDSKQQTALCHTHDYSPLSRHAPPRSTSLPSPLSLSPPVHAPHHAHRHDVDTPLLSDSPQPYGFTLTHRPKKNNNNTQLTDCL